jgi:hypothetical protein
VLERLILALVICAATSLPLVARADDRDFDIVNNNTLNQIDAVYLSPSDTTDWGANLLDDAIDPGQLRGIFFSDALVTCVYDIRVELRSGSVAELYDLDLCTASTITLDDDYITAR